LTRQTTLKPIRHYFVFSLFSAICCCPTGKYELNSRFKKTEDCIVGLIALGYSLKSSAKADVNLHDKSRLYSRRAFYWNIISVVLGIILVTERNSILSDLFNCFSLGIGTLLSNHSNHENDEQTNANKLWSKIKWCWSIHAINLQCQLTDVELSICFTH